MPRQVHRIQPGALGNQWLRVTKSHPYRRVDATLGHDYNPPPVRTIIESGFMAHHKSAVKRIRQTVKRTALNRSRLSRVKTFVKAAEDALASGDKSRAAAALREAEPEIQRGVSAGVVHRNTAARKISRLSKRLKSL